ncbi:MULTISPECIES: ead/Ea22-like family protein [Enterobacter]|uniref:ead/Ea22-like family protein n=1 Tax=Enterobacter TaxID=547 RepID=UPI0005EECE6F|nr:MULTISPECIES: ead/Ea22-like family protein [Enterobacter]EHE7802970.1 ead/Ea22-like family protein [Enterobacter hormaechei]EIY1157901.1 ead/Ea22-like family protein [Enterobacter hormaechei]EKL0728685.1 ead/Ea22-like family protein [Enterobacter hormaechei]EKS6498432.1 ead/Ea22-like family protein [Enterobacter hormaechei]EKS6630676.1 ead/Ea22-like family protein [Enterobacter hormaechei]
MSNIDKISKEALREVAEDAQKAHKWEGLENGLKADGYVSTTVRFIQRASPQTVLALLDELEAKDKQIADLKEAFSIALSAAGIDVPAAAGKGDAS